MLDLRFVVDNMDEVINKLSNRNGDFSYLYELVKLSDRRKEIILNESKKALRNEV